MKNHAVLEALLRPPIELWTTAVAWGIALIALVAPWALMMPPLLGLAAAVLAGVFGWVRLRQALLVLRYQRGLKFSQITRVAPSKLPATREQLYLGQGFEWTQQNTQRKLDAQRKEVESYVRPTAMELRWSALGTRMLNAVASQVATAENTGQALPSKARWARFITSVGGPLNPLYPHVDLGGSPILHGTGALEEAPVVLRQSARTGHLLVMGTTRVGKTRLLELLATQDIHAGHVTIVIDPKGDADLMLRLLAEARRAGREDQFYLFHLGYPEISARYNGIGSFSRITEVAGRATNALPSSGNSAAFKEFSWRFTNIVAQAQVALGRIPTYETLLRDVTGIEPLFMEYAHMVFRSHAQRGQFTNYLERLANLEADLMVRNKVQVDRAISTRAPEVIAMILWIKESRVTDNVLHGLVGAVSYDRSFYEKIIASLGPFLEKLTSGAVGKLISPDYFDPEDERPIFDWMSVMRQGGIVYAGLDALSDSVVSSAVGNSMLADLVSVGGKLYKTGLDPNRADGKLILPTVCCHFDEVNEIAGPEFVPMVNKLGGSGFRITAYTQSMFDIEAKVGDKAKAGQILDNFNHLVMLRVRSVPTANLVAEQVPQVNVVHLTPMSGVTDTAAQGTGVDFTSRNDDIVTTTKVPLIEPADILELPQGQAFALLEGNRRYKIRIPLADATNDPFVPESLRKVAIEMKRRYRTSERWASETDWLGNQPLGAAAGGLIVTDLAQDQGDDEGGGDAGSGRAQVREADSGSSSLLGQSAVMGNIMGHHG